MIKKKFIFAALVLCLLSTHQLWAGDDSAKSPAAPVWMSFDLGLKEAKKSNKKIFVDVYTDWCGWCKKMDKEVFSSSKIAPYLSDQYVLIKLNAESGAKASYKETQSSEMELARAFGVTGFPTFLFLESDGALITILPGFDDAFYSGNRCSLIGWNAIRVEIVVVDTYNFISKT